jgi:tRNA (adenine37-N6)-methyltransferase
MNDILFTPRPIGFARTPFKDTAQVPKGPGTKHEADGTIEILPEFAQGLKDIEGFSHLFVIWVFDRSDGFDLLGAPPGETTPHGVFATRSPRRPNPIALTVVELIRRDAARSRRRHARPDADPRHQAIHVQHSNRQTAARLAGRCRTAGRKSLTNRLTNSSRSSLAPSLNRHPCAVARRLARSRRRTDFR